MKHDLRNPLNHIRTTGVNGLMRTEKIRRCSKCVLPEHTPNIVFDEEGICNYCHTYRKFEYKGEAELLRLLDSQRKADGEYDCIVTLSGGRDSSYVLLKLVKDYDMRVLAVNYRNPFTHTQAEKNIENAIKSLNVDIVRFKLKNNVHERTFRKNVLAWFRRPSPALIPMMCIACKNIWWNILNIAKKHKIRCIVSGGNPLEYSSFKRELLHVSRDENVELAFIKTFYGLLQEVFKNPAYFDPSCIPTMVKGYLFGDPNAIGSRLVGHKITRLDLFHFIKWDEQEVLSRIETELDWDYPREFGSTWRFDCEVDFLKNFMYLKTLKLTEKDGFYAKLVREGLITRRDALSRLQKENKVFFDEMQSVLRKVGIEDITFLAKQGSITKHLHT